MQRLASPTLTLGAHGSTPADVGFAKKLVPYKVTRVPGLCSASSADAVQHVLYRWEALSKTRKLHQVPARPKLLQENSLQRKCFEAINFVKLQSNHFTKQIPKLVFLQKGTHQWQQHYKENLSVELLL